MSYAIQHRFLIRELTQPLCCHHGMHMQENVNGPSNLEKGPLRCTGMVQLTHQLKHTKTDLHKHVEHAATNVLHTAKPQLAWC